jgi:hypothetical protein
MELQTYKAHKRTSQASEYIHTQHKMITRHLFEYPAKPIEAKHIEKYMYEVEMREHIGE